MALPIEILLGIYLGLLTGIIPALVAWSLGFVFKYFTGVTVPGLAVVALGVAIAGVNGGLLGLYDEAVRNSPTLLTATLVVLMMTLYAHNRGDKMGAEFPRRLTLANLRKRTLSADVVELVGDRGQVRVTVSGEVIDMEGYPPLPADLRTTIRDGEWTFPADLPLSELESRLADRLRADHDLADVAVSIDEKARATVIAAPPASGLSKRIPPGKRAVSVSSLLPTGLARRDIVTLRFDGSEATGTVVSARSSGKDEEPPAMDADISTDGGESEETADVTPTPTAPTTTGGSGRVTVAVDRQDARRLLDVDHARIIVHARGTRREFELLSLVRQDGRRFRKVTLGANAPLTDTSIGDADVRDAYGVAILAVRRARDDDADRDAGWVLAPRGDTILGAGDELFVLGANDAITAFTEVVA